MLIDGIDATSMYLYVPACTCMYLFVPWYVYRTLCTYTLSNSKVYAASPTARIPVPTSSNEAPHIWKLTPLPMSASKPWCWYEMWNSLLHESTLPPSDHVGLRCGRIYRALHGNKQYVQTVVTGY